MQRYKIPPRRIMCLPLQNRTKNRLIYRRNSAERHAPARKNRTELLRLISRLYSHSRKSRESRKSRKSRKVVKVAEVAEVADPSNSNENTPRTNAVLSVGKLPCLSRKVASRGISV